MATFRADDKHVHARAYINTNLSQVVLELVLRLMPRDQQRDSLTTLVLCTLDHVRTDPDRLEVMTGLTNSSHRTILSYLLYVGLVRKERDLGAATERQLQFCPVS